MIPLGAALDTRRCRRMEATVAGQGRVGHKVALFRIIVSCTLVATLVAGCSTYTGPTVTLGGTDVRVLVADDYAELARGLQGYDELPNGEGMVFVYGDAAVRTFAMKEVAFPIDVLFIDEDLTVAAIEPLDPGDVRLVSSPGPCRYVVELPQGWAEERGIMVGDAFEFAENR